MIKIRVVHYINQFFAGIGGEAKAHIPPELREGYVGPGIELNKKLNSEAEVVATIICGDSYLDKNLDKAKGEILDIVREYKPDIFVAGPAFNKDTYGIACGAICKAVKDELGIPVVTAMYIENPGVKLYKKDVNIVSTDNFAGGMRKAMSMLSKLVLKLAKGEEIEFPAEEGIISRDSRMD